MKTKITVNFFKESGKWYDRVEIESQIEPYNISDIKLAVRELNPIANSMDHTIEISKDDMWNMYLVKAQI